MRRPATLLPAPAARLLGFVLLASLGVLQWRRMDESLSASRALLWVAAAVLAVLLLLAAERRRGPLAVPAAATAGLAAAVGCSGLELRFLDPEHWGELAEGLARGTEALGGARLPYAGSDPWPREALELGGAALTVAGAYLAFWPRPGGHGSPPAALAVLLALLVVPVVAMSAAAPLALGAAAGAATVCFLFLERMPVRPGLSAAVLATTVLGASLPLGAAADREEPWFDYRAFAEGLGPVEPVRFDWQHGYGPIDWPRDGREVFRARTDVPLYWKAETLGDFRGDGWRTTVRGDPDGNGPSADLPDDYARRPGWNRRVQVVLRRLETQTLVGPGTILSLEEAARGLSAEWVPGRWIASRELGRGDSYTVEAHVPQPTPEQLATATAGARGRQSDALRMTLPLREDARAGTPELPRPDGARARHVEEVTVIFPAFGAAKERPRAHFELVDEPGDGPAALRRTPYRRTWRLARRLRRGAVSPWEYVRRVNALLNSDSFRYSERPPRPAEGVPPLEAFLNDDREGYCQQFSGAMALLLRMGGVPARVAAGFSPGGYRRSRREWVIRDVDAHSWVEAWLDGVGWVTVDPTPAATPARSQTAVLEVPGEPSETEATAPIPGDGSEPPAPSPEGARPEQPAPGGAAASPDRPGTPWALWAGGLVALLAGAAIAARRRSGDPSPERQLAELERALRRSGRPVPAGVTLVELERRLGRSPYLRALRAARYASRPVRPTAAQRAAFRRELGAGLGWGGRLRALWALPPRPGGLPFAVRAGRRRADGPDSSDG